MKVILLMAMTADGLTAKNSSEFVDWTEKEDKKIFVDVTKRSGAVIMGRNTYKTIEKPLKNRKNIVYSKSVKGEYPDQDLFYTSEKPELLLKKLETEGFKEVVLIGGSEINTLFARSNLIDELLLTLSPVFFGSGLTMFTDKIEFDLKLKEFNRIGSDSILIRYEILK
ncbi:MAG: dihydrofolate reductase [Desulfobacterales bacterium]|nr:dihydrofolate reductase [Desulfobacterales bacterium]MCP4159242.1 dihydrofolate reductase [Deltaproteobacteria bacterium]